MSTNKFELWVSIGATSKGKLRGSLTANPLEYDPDEINHGRVVTEFRGVTDILDRATRRFQELGYTVTPETGYRRGSGWSWEPDYGDDGMFKRLATMGEPEVTQEITVNGCIYRLVEDANV
jgi:hypothetical protein